MKNQHHLARTHRLATTALLGGCVFAALLALLPPLHAAPAAAPAYSIVARFPLPTKSTSYDYLRADPAARRLYLTLGKTVAVLDLDTGKPLGEIAGLKRAHGVALSPDTNHGFATSGVDDQITMFDLKTLATLKTIKSTGSNPDAIEYDPLTKRVYAANHGNGTITVLDAATGDIAGTVDFANYGGGKLEALAFDHHDGRARGYVNAEDKSAVYVYDLATLKPLAKYPAAPAEGGTGLAIDPAARRLFMATNGSNTMTVLDADTGKIIATLPTGKDADGLTYNPATKRIYVPCVDGTLTIIQQQSADKYTVHQTLPTQRGCRTITLDEKTARVLTYSPKYAPAPAPVKGAPRPPRPAAIPGTFEVLVIGTK